jgi:hypothetical protein
MIDLLIDERDALKMDLDVFRAQADALSLC